MRVGGGDGGAGIMAIVVAAAELGFHGWMDLITPRFVQICGNGCVVELYLAG